MAEETPSENPKDQVPNTVQEEKLKGLDALRVGLIGRITGRLHNAMIEGKPLDRTTVPRSGSLVGDKIVFDIPRQRLYDEVGRPIEQVVQAQDLGDIACDIAAEETPLLLSIRSDEFESLSAKSEEVLTYATLAQQRIAKDQEEIEQLKMETRALLKQLHAA